MIKWIKVLFSCEELRINTFFIILSVPLHITINVHEEKSGYVSTFLDFHLSFHWPGDASAR